MALGHGNIGMDLVDVLINIDIVDDVDGDGDAPPGVVLHGSLPRPTSNEPAPTNMTSYFLRLRENDVRRYI